MRNSIADRDLSGLVTNMSHSRKTNRDHAKKTQRPMLEDEVIADQLETLLTPAITAQQLPHKRTTIVNWG